MTVTRTTFDDEALRSWWDDAYASGTLLVDTCFQSWTWNAAWWEVFGASDPARELFLLKGERNGRILFAAPLFLQRTRVGPTTAWERLLWIADELSPYPDLVTTSVDGAAMWDSILAYLRSDHPHAWLQLSDVFSWSTTANWHPASARLETGPGSTCLRLPLPAKGSAEVEQLVRPAFRRTFVKAQREAEARTTVRWKAIHAPDAAQRELVAELNLQRFGSRSFFSDATNRRFFDLLAEGDRNEETLAVLEVDGAPRHVIHGYYHAEIFYYFLSGMTSDGALDAPGFVNFRGLFASLLDRGAACFDFLRGTERYKRDLGGVAAESVHLRVIPLGAEFSYRMARAAKTMRHALRKKRVSAEERP
jgi:CelD/BcsL family acetyltransferase involved in cellulose biosynthesis